jgi:hypothetical protein
MNYQKINKDDDLMFLNMISLMRYHMGYKNESIQGNLYLMPIPGNFTTAIILKFAGLGTSVTAFEF